MLLKIVMCVIIGYLCGNISNGYLVGRMHHIDIRNYGSGNAGATNALRALGKKAGLLVFLGDFMKVYIPAALIHYVVFAGEDYASLLCEITGFAGVLGHNYPFWLHFKGGKGISSTGGAMIATDWRFTLFIPVFVGIVAATKYVSVGSMFVVLLYPAFIAIAKRGCAYYVPMVIVAVLFTVSGVYTHRTNLKRLMNGTERKINQKLDIQAASAKENVPDTDVRNKE